MTGTATTDYVYSLLRSQSPRRSISSQSTDSRPSSPYNSDDEEEKLVRPRRSLDVSQPFRWLKTRRRDATPSTLGLLLAYFALNIGLTFYNKTLLNGFPYPYFITAVHTGSGVLGCAALRLLGVPFVPRTSTNEDIESVVTSSEKQSGSASTTSRLSPVRLAVILAYSSLYTANIAASNASLGLVSVPLHQVIRSTCPAFTLLLAVTLLGGARPSTSKMAALVPIVGGAAMSCYGEMAFTSAGFVWTVVGTVLAALKTVATNTLQGGEEKEGRREALPRLSALQLLELMSPLACIQCAMASYCSGELKQVLVNLSASPSSLVLLLAGNGVLAFMLNVASFRTNKATGPLTMTVVGNAKQVVTVLVAVRLFDLRIAAVNAAGIVLALAGTAWYGMVAVRDKRQSSTRPH